MGNAIKFTEIDRPILTLTPEELKRRDAEFSKVFDKALDKAFNEAVKRHFAMLHQEVFAILGPVFDALFDQAVERHRDMLRDEAMDAAIEASGLMPYWVGGERFLSKWPEPAGEQ
jgi:hypothetical protein